MTELKGLNCYHRPPSPLETQFRSPSFTQRSFYVLNCGHVLDFTSLSYLTICRIESLSLNFPGFLRGFSGILPGSFRDPSGVHPGSFRDPSGILPGSFRDPSGILPGSFRDPSGILPGSFRDFSASRRDILLHVP